MSSDPMALEVGAAPRSRVLRQARPGSCLEAVTARSGRSQRRSIPTLLWLGLRSRRLAILLLVVVTLLSTLGTAFPQQAQVGPVTYARWAGQNPGWSAVASQLSLDSLYSAWWFLGLFALLYVNTLACSLPQMRSAWKHTLRWSMAVEPGRRETSFEVSVAREDLDALGQVAGLLRGRGYRVRMMGGGLLARKGTMAAWGSPIFHLGLVAVFTGAAIGGLLGFSGYVEVGEGQGFVEGQGSYMQSAQGPLFGRARSLGAISLPGLAHRGFAVRLDRFSITESSWGKDIPGDTVSEVTILENGQDVRRAAIGINQALEHDGLSIYPSSAFGLAPVFELELPDGSRDTGLVNLASKGNGLYENTLYLPGTIFRMTVRARDGDSGLEATIVERRLKRFDGRLEPGQTVKLGGATLTLKGVRHWTGLRVENDPGKPVLYLGFGLTVLGLALNFVTFRREIWAHPAGAGQGRIIRLGGRSPGLKALMNDELAEIAGSLESTPGPGDGPGGREIERK